MYMRGFYTEQPELPSRIGYEASGVVEGVGPGVDRKWIGKRVATIPGFSLNKYGVLGEEAIVPVTALGEYPARLSDTEAAAIWMQYLTAYGALIQYGRLTKNDFVIVTAASSSVGLAALQIVKAEGATPIAATRTSKKRDELLAAGAAHVIATKEENLIKRVAQITDGAGARLIFDPVAGPYIETLAQAAARGGIIFEYGALSMEPTPFPLFTALGKALSVQGYSVTSITGDPVLLNPAKEYVFERLKDGRFHPKIAKTFSLENAAEAYRYLESNEQLGKIVISVNGGYE
jgi:NADPH:quinone reductase-like Zn-dependent oxidoreductase